MALFPRRGTTHVYAIGRPVLPYGLKTAKSLSLEGGPASDNATFRQQALYPAYAPLDRIWKPSVAAPIDLEATIEAQVRHVHRPYRLAKVLVDLYQLWARD